MDEWSKAFGYAKHRHHIWNKKTVPALLSASPAEEKGMIRSVTVAPEYLIRIP